MVRDGESSSKRNNPILKHKQVLTGPEEEELEDPRVEDYRSFLLTSYLKYKSKSTELMETVNKINTQREDVIDQMIRTCSHPSLLHDNEYDSKYDQLEMSLQWLRQLNRQHSELMTKMSKRSAVAEGFIHQFLTLNQLVVETKEGAEWVVGFRQDNGWHGAVVIPLAVSKPLKDEIVAICCAGGVPLL